MQKLSFQKTPTPRRFGLGAVLGISMLGMVAVTSTGVLYSQNLGAGSISGTITDASGAAVPNAKITLSEPSTGFSKQLQSSGSGYYATGSLAPGVYKVHVEASGFSTTDEEITVQVGNTANGNLKLGVGTATQQVEVQGSAIGIDMEQTQIQGVLTAQQIANLPVNGRNFLDLAQLQPGVQIQDGTSFDPTKNGFASISFGGRFGRTARIELDGLDISDENVGTTTQNISQDAIGEFQIAQSNLDISTSITSSGSVNIVSKSGSNAIHGDEFWYLRDKRAGGADFPGGEDNYLQRNDVGGAVGGALIPDKTFYFFSAENYVQHLAVPVSLGGTPLAAITQAGGPGGSYSSPYHETDLLGRFDFNLPHGARAFVRGAYNENRDTGAFGGNNFSPFLNGNNTPNVGGGLDFLTGNFSHSLRVGYFKFVNHITDATAGTSIFDPTPGINLVIGAYSSGANLLAPQTTIQTNKQFRYDGSWTKGNHTLRYGAGVNHLLGGGFASFFGLAPQVQLDYSAGAAGGPLVADGLTGVSNPQNYLVTPASGSSNAITLGNGLGYDTEIPQFGFPGGGQEDWRITAYLGDQFKVSSRINVNYGVRYIRDTGRNDADLPAIPFLNQIAPGLGNKVHQPNSNFGPQAGVAYDLTGKGTTVIRAGAGIYYENNVWNNVLFDRPVRLQTGEFFGDATVCPTASVPIPGSAPITTIDGTATGTKISSICGQAVGNVYPQIAELEATYQRLTAAAGAQANGNYIGPGANQAKAVGPFVNGDQLFDPKYKTPESYQMNIGIQRQLSKSIVLTADYLRNVGQNFLLGVDENHAGDVRNFNKAGAQAAIAATLAQCGVSTVDEAIISCPGVNGPGVGATIGTFAANGLDSINQSGGGSPNTNFAFQGSNPTFGQTSFLTPSGRSVYNALQVTATGHAGHVRNYLGATDFTVAYTYSHFSSTGGSNDTATGGSGGDQDFGSNVLDNNNPSKYFGPNSLDRHQQFSASLGTEIYKGFRLDSIGHLYSALPATISLPTQGGGDIFISDTGGDGTVGDPLPGTNVGAFMRQVGPHSINNVINAYNTTSAGTPTPAGAVLVNNGILTLAQLKALGAVQQTIPLAPSNQVGNDILRVFDVTASYHFKVGESLSIEPRVQAFNILNFANFDGPGGLGTTRESGQLNGQPGSVNGTTYANQDVYRIGLGTGVFALGAPRQLEFGLKLSF